MPNISRTYSGSIVILIALVVLIAAFLVINPFPAKSVSTTTVVSTEVVTNQMTVIAPTTIVLTHNTSITDTLTFTSTIQGIIPPINDVLISNISLSDYTWSVAANPLSNMIYAISPLSNLTEINGSSNTIVKTLDIGPLGSNFVTVNPATNMIYSGDSIINGTDFVLIGHFSYDISYIAVDPKTDRIFAISSDFAPKGNDSLLIFNGMNNSLLDIIQLNASATTLAINSVTNSVYVPLCTDESLCAPIYMLVMNGTSLQVSAKFLVDPNESAGLPFSVAVDSLTNMVYMTDQDLVTINGTSNAVVAKTVLSAYTIQCRGVAVNERYNQIYVSGWGVGDFGSFFIVNGQNYSILNAFAGTGGPVGIAYNPTNSEIYVADSQTKSVLALNSTAFVLS